MVTRPADISAHAASFLPVRAEHPMLDIPYVMGIDGRQYKGIRLSLVMAEIAGLMDPGLEGATRMMRLQFPFQGFSVTLELMGLVQSIDAKKGVATVAFVEPGADHLPQMRHVMNSYIAGDLVGLGGVIRVAASVPSPAARAAKALARRGLSFGQVLRSVGMMAATVVLVAALATLVYGRLFTTPIAAPGRVVQDGTTLEAIAAGQIDYVNLTAAIGEVAFTIRTTGGELLSIAMPCACKAELLGGDVGATVLAGEPVMTVFEADAALMMTAQLASEDLLKLAFADHVRIRFADGSRMQATVDTQSLPGAAGEGLAEVRLIPNTPLPASRLGEMAQLTLIRPMPAVFTRIDTYLRPKLAVAFGEF